MRILILVSIVALFPTGAVARGVRSAPVPQLCRLAHVVAIGEVETIESSGIETTLSYPTLDEFTFQWLRVRVSLSAVLKGRIDKGHIDVAMLAVKANNGRPLFKVDGPLMIHPKVGDKYVMFLAPTPKKGLYTSIFAPYDEENAVFILERDSPRYSMEGVSKAPEVKDYRDFRQEIRDMICILVDDAGEMTPDGIERFRAKYGRELQVSSEGRTMPLEWKKHTSKTGWSWDVPKNKASTAEQDGD